MVQKRGGFMTHYIVQAPPLILHLIVYKKKIKTKGIMEYDINLNIYLKTTVIRYELSPGIIFTQNNIFILY